MKKLSLSGALILLVMLFAPVVLFGQFPRIRYNLAGYTPNAEQRIIVLSKTDDLSAKKWNLYKGNESIANGILGASLTKANEHTPVNFNYEIKFHATTPGAYQLIVETLDPVTITIKSPPYKEFVKEVLLGLRARRSFSDGSYFHEKSHDGDASCIVREHNGASSFHHDNWENTSKKVNMLGGWYDAGDYIKFTHTIAYTAYNILLAYEINAGIFSGLKHQANTSTFNDLLEEAHHGLSYLLKTMPTKELFIIQVADSFDHEAGSRLPENDFFWNGKRPAFSSKSRTQMSLTVAALSIGARIFNDEDRGFAENCKTKAVEIYNEMQSGNNVVNSSYYRTTDNIFYQDDSYWDNMALAAAELFKTTGIQVYLDDANTYATKAGAAYWCAWESLNMKAFYRLATIGQSYPEFVTDLDYFYNRAYVNSNIWNHPHEYTWGSLYSQFGVANSALCYQLLNPEAKYLNMAKDVIDYTFGLNNWGYCFIVNDKFEPSNKTSYAQIYREQEDKFPIPFGEIAAGPFSMGEFQDAQNDNDFDPPFTDYMENTLKIEPTTDYYKNYNSSSIGYYEYKSIYFTETTICGLSDGILLLALADKLFSTITNSCEILEPANNQVFKKLPPEPVTMKVKSSDPDGIKSVAFKSGNKNLAVFTDNPGKQEREDVLEYMSNVLQPGTYDLTAVVTDVKGETTKCPVHTIQIIDNSSYVVMVDPGTGGKTIPSCTPFTLVAEAEDASGITQVNFKSGPYTRKATYIGNNRYSWHSPDGIITPGNYPVYAEMVTNNGIKVSEPVTLTVVDYPPVVEIESPLQKDYLVTETIPVIVNVSDNCGESSLTINYFLDNASIQKPTSFSGLSEGSHTFKVMVSDGVNSTVESIVIFTIGPSCNFQVFDSNKVYIGGDKVLYNNIGYKAKWWTQYETPPGTSGVWECICNCPPPSASNLKSTEKKQQGIRNKAVELDELNIFPNPFTNHIKFEFSIQNKGIVQLRIYNQAGVEIETIINEVMQPGCYSVKFDGSNVPPGSYFYRFIVNNEVQSGYLIKE